MSSCRRRGVDTDLATCFDALGLEGLRFLCPGAGGDSRGASVVEEIALSRPACDDSSTAYASAEDGMEGRRN